MEILIYVLTFYQFYRYCCAAAAIRESSLYNKLTKVKPVGANIGKNFMPLTEIPPPRTRDPVYHYHGGRRHLPEECGQTTARQVWEGGKVHIFDEYYVDRDKKTVATVIVPDHIDYRHFQVTTPIPYFTARNIDAIGHHPTTVKAEHPSECEKIYQDHMNDQYSDEETEYSEESLEVARMPIYPDENPSPSQEQELNALYNDDDLA